MEQRLFMSKLKVQGQNLESSNDQVQIGIRKWKLDDDFIQFMQIGKQEQNKLQPYCIYCKLSYQTDTEFKQHLLQGHNRLQMLIYQQYLNSAFYQTNVNASRQKFTYDVYQMSQQRPQNTQDQKPNNKDIRNQGIDLKWKIEFCMQEIIEELDEEQEHENGQSNSNNMVLNYVKIINIILKLIINLKETCKYFINLIKIDIMVYAIAISSVLALVFLMSMQSMDPKCVERKDEHRWQGCPFIYYFQMNFNHFIVYHFIGTMIFQVVMNCQQLLDKKSYEYIAQFIIILLLLVRTFQQKIDVAYRIDEVIVVVYFTMALTLFMVFRHISRNRMMIQILKLTQTLGLVFIILIFRNVFKYISNYDSTYVLMFSQYTSFGMKILVNYIIKQRIKMEHYYDDILMISVAVYIFDYNLLLRFMLIEDISSFRQLVLMINFIIIQVKSIFNINIAYYIIKGSIQKALIFSLGAFYYQYIIQFFNYILEMWYASLIKYFIAVVIQKVTLILQKIFQTNNIQAYQLLIQNIANNQYLQTKIQLDQLNQLICQQQLISYFLFLMIQVVRLVIEIMDSDKFKNKRYWIIQQIDIQKYVKLTINNLLAFNLMIVLIVFLLVFIKFRRQNTPLKWEFMSQNMFQRSFIWIFYLINFNRNIFQK